MVRDSSKIPCDTVLELCEKYFSEYGLSTFKLEVPMMKAGAAANRNGVIEKILKNRSNVVTEFNSANSIVEAGASPQADDDAIRAVYQLTSWILHPSVSPSDETRHTFSGSLQHWHKDCTQGFVCLVAEPLHEPDENDSQSTSNRPKSRWRPVGGGIISWRDLDPQERQINALWCRRNLTPELQRSNFIEHLSLFLLATAFDIGSEHVGETSTLVSILDNYLRLFPRDAVSYMTCNETGVCLGAHYETPTDGGNHQSHPKAKCKCANLVKDPTSFKFWGLNKSRFNEICAKQISKYHGNLYLDLSGNRSNRSTTLNGIHRIDRRSLPAVREKRYSECMDSSNSLEEEDASLQQPKKRRDLRDPR